MKHLLLIATLILSSLEAGADTQPGVVTKLNYSTQGKSLAKKLPTRSLAFVPEEVSFPAGSQKLKFEKALSLIEEVMNSEEFKIKVIAYVRTVNSQQVRSYQKNFLWNDTHKRLSNEEIYQVIMNGDEKMKPGTLGEMNFNSWVKMCSGWRGATTWCRSVVGSTTPHTDFWITLNWIFYSYFETHHMVANMVHEWLHLLGFLHGSARVHEEVPYVVGEIAGEVAKDILKRENGLY